MIADRIEAGVLAQPLNRGPDFRQPPPRRPSCAWLGEPAFDLVKVGKCLVGVAQVSPHTAVRSAARVGYWHLAIGADAVDPSLNFGRINESASGDVGVCLGDPLSLPSDPVLAVGSGLGIRAVVGRARGCVHPVKYNPDCRQLPGLRRATVLRRRQAQLSS